MDGRMIHDRSANARRLALATLADPRRDESTNGEIVTRLSRNVTSVQRSVSFPANFSLIPKLTVNQRRNFSDRLAKPRLAWKYSASQRDGSQTF